VIDYWALPHTFNWWGACIDAKLASPWVKPYTLAEFATDVFFERLMWGDQAKH
jgi:hypothetical protein